MAVASLLVLLALGILHTMATFVSKNPLSSLGCKLCITYGEWLSAPPCAPPVSWEPISPSLSPRGEQSGWCSEEGPPRSLVLPAAPAGCSVSECASLSLWKPLLHRTHTTVVMTKECGFAHPQVLPMALSTCGSSLMPCFLASQNTHNHSDNQGMRFCSSSGPADGPVYLWFISDAVFLGLMVQSSGSMVLLHRHRQRVQYVHTRSGHHRCPPETRATHTILMLVVTFVIVYILNSIFSFYIASFSNIHLCLIQTAHILVSCFPTFSPFLLILRDPRFPRFCSHVVRSHGWSANV